MRTCIVCVCVCVCPPLRPLITSHVKDTHNNRIMKFYGYFVALYDKLKPTINIAMCDYIRTE